MNAGLARIPAWLKICNEFAPPLGGFTLAASHSAMNSKPVVAVAIKPWEFIQLQFALLALLHEPR